jgi:putative selenate reductase FAD-binding subunit
MEYLRPKTVDEALKLLDEGKPLAGGTQLTVDRYELTKVIDLQSLGLDEVSEKDGVVHLGAMSTLQRLLATDLPLPEGLKRACRAEAAWNIRNQATLGGLLMRADGRSPLLTALAALAPQLKLAPGDEELNLTTFFERRQSEGRNFLLLEICFDHPACYAYDSVARAPMDIPLVSATAAVVGQAKESLQVAIGGYGEQPIFWNEILDPEDKTAIITTVSEKAMKHFHAASDAFASAEYRAEIVGILSRRVVNEVLEAC